MNFDLQLVSTIGELFVKYESSRTNANGIDDIYVQRTDKIKHD